MYQFHRHLLTFGVVCGAVGLYYVSPYITVLCVIVGACVYVYQQNLVNLQVQIPIGTLKARFSLFRSWIQSLDFLPMKGHQPLKPSVGLTESRVPAYSVGNSHLSVSHRPSYTRNRYSCSDENSDTFNRKNGFPKYYPSSQNSFESSSRLESKMYSSNSDDSLKLRDNRFNLSSRLSPWESSENSHRENRSMKTVQTVAGPLLSSTRYNRNSGTSFDLGLYVDASSPGLATRVVQYAEDSGLVNNKIVTHQPQYSSPGQFPRVQLNRSALKLPVLSPHNSQKLSRRSMNIRITSPEQYGTRLLSSSSRSPSGLSSSMQIEPSTKSLLETLREISRKRMHSQLDDDDDDATKRQRKSELGYSPNKPGAIPNGLIVDNELQAKRTREDSPKQLNGQIQQPSKRFRNNEILSSLSSSRKMLQGGGIKRKTNSLDWSRSSTPVFGKQLKTTEFNPAAIPIISTITTTSKVKDLSPEISNQESHQGSKKNLNGGSTNPSPAVLKSSTSPVTSSNQTSLNNHQMKSKTESSGQQLDIFKLVTEPCPLDDPELLKERHSFDRRARLRSMLATLNRSEPEENCDNTESAFGAISTSATPVPAACLSTATYTTSVLPTIPFSSAETTKGISLIPQVKTTKHVTFSEFTTAGPISSVPTTTNFDSNNKAETCTTTATQPSDNSDDLARAPTRPLTFMTNNIDAPVVSTTSQTSKSQVPFELTTSPSFTQIPYTSTTNSITSTPMSFSFGAVTTATNTSTSTTNINLPTSTSAAPIAFTPTSLKPIMFGVTVSQEPNVAGNSFVAASSTGKSLFGNVANTSLSMTSTTTPLNFGFGSNATSNTSGNLSFTSPSVSTHNATSGALFGLQQTSAPTNTPPPKGGMFTSPSLTTQPVEIKTTTAPVVFGFSLIKPITTDQSSSSGSVGGFSSSSASTVIAVTSKTDAEPKGPMFGVSSGQQSGFGSGLFGTPASSSLGATSTAVKFGNTPTTSQSNNAASTLNHQTSGFGVSSSLAQGQQETSGFTFGNQSSNTSATAVQAQPKEGGFSFGTPTTSNAVMQVQPKPFAFGSQPPSLSSSVPAFGAQSNKPSAMGGFSFLANQGSGTSVVGSTGFQMSQPTSATQNSSGGFKFDFSNSNKAAGTAPTTTSATPTFGGMFGQAVTTNPVSTIVPTSQTFQFGSLESANKPSFAFGSSSTPNNTGNVCNTMTGGVSQSRVEGFGNPFGSTSTTSQQPGDANLQKSQGPFAFGANAGSGFGAQATSTSNNAFAFGSSATVEKKGSAFVFGTSSGGIQSQPLQNPNGFNFNAGSNTTTPAMQNPNSSGLFGQSTQQSPAAPAFAFGSGGTQASGGFNFGSQSSSTPNFSAGPSSSNAFQLGSSSTPAFGGVAVPAQNMFSIGSGSTAPRARVSRPRRPK